MRKIICILMLLAPMFVIANSKYTAGFEVGSHFQISKPVNLNYTLKSYSRIVLLDKGISTFINAKFVNGFKVNPYVFVGAGLGVEFSKWEESELWLYSGSYRTVNYDAINMPLFARFKVNFTNTKISPFFKVDLGYNFLVNSVFKWEYRGLSYKRGGFLLTPSFGLDINIYEKQKIYLLFDYVLQVQAENTEYTLNSIHSLGFKIGMLF